MSTSNHKEVLLAAVTEIFDKLKGAPENEDVRLFHQAVAAKNLLRPADIWALVARTWSPEHPEAAARLKALLAQPLAPSRVSHLLAGDEGLHAPTRERLLKQLRGKTPTPATLTAGMRFVSDAPDSVAGMPKFVENLLTAFTNAKDLSVDPPKYIWKSQNWRERVNTTDFLKAVAGSGALLGNHYLVKSMLDSGEIHADWLVGRDPGPRLATQLTQAALQQPERHPRWLANLPDRLEWPVLWAQADLQPWLSPGRAVATFRIALQVAKPTQMRGLIKSPMLDKLGPAQLQASASDIQDPRCLFLLHKARPEILSTDWVRREIRRRLQQGTPTQRKRDLLERFVLPFLRKEDPDSCRNVWQMTMQACLRKDSVSFNETFRALGELPGFRQQGPVAAATLLWLHRKDHAQLQKSAETLYGPEGLKWAQLMLALDLTDAPLSTWRQSFPAALAALETPTQGGSDASHRLSA